MADGLADSEKSSPLAPGDGASRFRSFAGTISRGRDVISSEGKFLGQVDRVEGDHIVLSPVNKDETDTYFVPLSLIDGIAQDQVLLASRGDGTFGLGAEP